MRFESKIAITGILTYLVYGLYNLFGQPQQFVPPLFFDYLFIAVLSVIFLYRLKFNIDFISILFIGLSITCAGLLETQVSSSFVLAIICLVTLPVAFILNGASVLMNFRSLKFSLRLITVLFFAGIIFFIVFQMINIGNELNNEESQFDSTPFLYWFTGFLAMSMSSFKLFYSQLSDGQVRFFTLVFLSAFFDLATYLSLYFLL